MLIQLWAITPTPEAPTTLHNKNSFQYTKLSHYIFTLCNVLIIKYSPTIYCFYFCVIIIAFNLLFLIICLFEVANKNNNIMTTHIKTKNTPTQETI